MKSVYLEKYRTIAQRYVKALTGIAEENNSWESISEDLSKLATLFSENSQIESFLLHPTVPIEDKKDVIEKSLKSSLSETIYNLLNILIDKNRPYLLGSINEIFKEQYYKKQNILTVKAITAVELQQNNHEKLVAKLENIYNKKINLISEVNSTIIAGMIIQIEDKIIDGSVKTKIESLKKQLL